MSRTPRHLAVLGALSLVLFAGVFVAASFGALVGPWLTFATCISSLEPQVQPGLYVDSPTSATACFGALTETSTPIVGATMLVICPALAINTILMTYAGWSAALVTRTLRAISRALIQIQGFARLPLAPIGLIVPAARVSMVRAAFAAPTGLLDAPNRTARRGPPVALAF